MHSLRAVLALVAIAIGSVAHAHDGRAIGGSGVVTSSKAYDAYGALDISGFASWYVNSVTDTAAFRVERLANNAASGTSYPLRLALFVTQDPVGPAPFAYWTLTHQDQPGLTANGSRMDIRQSGDLESTPPDGIYYLSIGVFEQEPGCAAPDGYCLDDFFTFGDRLRMTNGFWTTVSDPVAQTTTAVEYFNAGFGHYFMTADPEEIAALDAGAYDGAFQRTGETWKVWTSGDGLDVCRFFTTPGMFGSKSSHFFTANAAECAALQANPAWIFEKIAGKVAKPTNGICPAGTQMLYRLYNDGQTGAPNHRYTTSTAIRLQMIAQGFVPEDSNNDCVPL